ncbi:MAG TPA: T9SS type A sorting domain-containing protein [Bacteroidales bacterium]|nr:T9SS type A sorting domain-containing protein [Bacteroidales bacterium]
MIKFIYLTIICSSLSLCVLGADIVVNNTNNSGTGSLREAITQANSSPIGFDNIIFAIPVDDPNYDESTGVFTINLISVLPLISSPNITIDGNTQQSLTGNTNIEGPEIKLSGGGTLEYGFRVGGPSNTFKNLIIAGFEYGFQIYGTYAYSNIIESNYIGTTYDGNAADSNEYGIGISGDAYNIIIRNNLISGNITAGIACSGAHDIEICGNKIGTDITGLLQLSNANGIMTENINDFIIGGEVPAKRNIISGNSESGLIISGESSGNNTIIGNFIGTSINGNDSVPNGNGIMIVNASDNQIGGNSTGKRNVISGNRSIGLLINGTGANLNIAEGNYIGIDVSGMQALSNHYGVIIKADADNNRIGGNTPEQRNVISANHEIGVYIEACDNNVVSGNFIGTDCTGTGTFYYNEGQDSLIQANGAEINTVSKHNIIGGNTEGERNIISGNRVYGAIYYGQVSENNIAGNYIGTDVTGTYSIPNATGICVDDASNHNIIENNVLSGNISYGLFIVTQGSDANIFRGNIVGLNAEGNDTVPNDVGLIIAAGAKYNVIGGENETDRNIFSGNRYGAIEVSDNGTKYNEIRNNFIGTDITGFEALPNNFGIAVGGMARGTIIDKNIISGNDSFGLVLGENSDSTVVTGNKIGTSADGLTDLGNKASGIVITSGANSNFIGTIENPNIIAFNDSLGIIIMDNTTIKNRISGNSIHHNNYLGIDIFPFGVNENDTGDTDSGPNQQMNFPVITNNWFDTENWYAVIEGNLDTENPENCIVEIYAAVQDDIFTNGEGFQYIATAYPDESGDWVAHCSDGAGGEFITALAIDENGNTSEFSANFVHYTNSENIYLNFDDFTVFPNPAKDIFSVFIPENTRQCELRCYNMSGRLIYSSNYTEIFSTTIDFSANEMNLKSGIYFIQIHTEIGKLYDFKLSISE